ncbi:hypothetical protein ES703_63637 [subsurface metagenome]
MTSLIGSTVHAYIVEKMARTNQDNHFLVFPLLCTDSIECHDFVPCRLSAVKPFEHHLQPSPFHLMREFCALENRTDECPVFFMREVGIRDDFLLFPGKRIPSLHPDLSDEFPRGIQRVKRNPAVFGQFKNSFIESKIEIPGHIPLRFLNELFMRQDAHVPFIQSLLMADREHL